MVVLSNLIRKGLGLGFLPDLSDDKEKLRNCQF
jgi:hypothetical protein